MGVLIWWYWYLYEIFYWLSNVPDFPILICKNLVISAVREGVAFPQNTLNSCLWFMNTSSWQTAVKQKLWFHYDSIQYSNFINNPMLQEDNKRNTPPNDHNHFYVERQSGSKSKHIKFEICEAVVKCEIFDFSLTHRTMPRVKMRKILTGPSVHIRREVMPSF